MNKFMNVLQENRAKLDQYVPIVARVHGPSHPVFYEVQSEYNKMVDKFNDNNYDVKSELNALDKITEGFIIPSDTCETYEAVYNMLEELFNSYEQ